MDTQQLESTAIGVVQSLLDCPPDQLSRMVRLEAELGAAAELHERSMQIIEDALGARPNGDTWRAQQIAKEITSLRERLRKALSASITITPCSDGVVEAVLSDNRGQIVQFLGLHRNDPEFETKMMLWVGKLITMMCAPENPGAAA
jgi:hypothetical protein